jgi:hypothetical protein
MRIYVFAVIAALALPSAALAKKKKPATAATAEKKKDNDIPPPNDPRSNEGVQGKRNAAIDEQRAGDPTPFQPSRP